MSTEPSLLHFYIQQFHQGQYELLGIISLFKRPLETGALLGLLREMESIKHTPLANMDEEIVLKQVKELTSAHLVEMINDDKVICHSLIQGYFRRTFRLRGCRKEIAVFLQKRLPDTQPQNIEEVRDLVNAVQLLCDEDDYLTANHLFNSLVAGSGGSLSAIPERLQCCLAFVGDNERQKKTEAILGKGTAAVYITSIILYNMKLGHFSQVKEWWEKGMQLCRILQDERAKSLPENEIKALEQALGNIRQTQKLFVHKTKS